MNSISGYIDKHPGEAQRLVGLNYDQLKQLRNQVFALRTQSELEAELKKTRIIKKGGGRKTKLSFEEQILLTLIYLRQLTTFQLLGIQFGVSETTANDTFNYWFPPFRKVATTKLAWAGKKNESDYKIVKEILTEFELIVDSCEQPIEKPGEYQEQKKHYSGKKKKHTKKNQLIVLPNGKDIVDVVAGKPGPKSDVKLFRESRKGFEKNQKFNGDKPYEGE